MFTLAPKCEYSQFLEEKSCICKTSGIEVNPDDVNSKLKPHQRDAVIWALNGGRRALFESFGLGKTVQQLEILRIIGDRESGRQLIVCPLGVKQEFSVDAKKFKISEPTFIRWTDEIGPDGLYITNYESIRDGRLDVNLFNAISLDEASVLRSYGSKTFQEFLTLFDSIKYRFVATATPSPNRYKELIHYAGFLGIMDTGQALTRWFKRDSSKANNLTLYPHKEKEFWLWVSSWALFLQRPSDLGYSDDGYVLPKLHVHYHKVKANSSPTVDRDGQMGMFPDASLSLSSASREKRNSLQQRIDKMVEILSIDPGSHYLLWHDQEAERHAIKAAIPMAVEVYGSLDLETREQRIIDFSNGKFPYLASKPVLSGSGCNFQRHCNKAIFLGIGFKFNDFIQSVHRIYRYLQNKECHIHIIYADTEEHILEVLLEKWKRHDEMVEKMTKIIKKYGLSHKKLSEEMRRSIGVERVEFKGDNWTMVNNDCVEECRGMKSNSVDLIHTSIPFANHYEYTPSYNDFGHTQSNDHFWAQMDFLTPELLRILKPGRIYACHVKDRVNFGNVTGKGVPTISPFHCEAIFHCMEHGFDYLGMITVVTDVVRENNQTYRLGWSEQCKDGTKMGVGSPEYIIIMRKPQTDRTRAYADIPVTKTKDEYTRAQWQVDAHAFWRSSGDRLLSTEELSKMKPDALSRVFTEQSLKKIYSYKDHIAIGNALDEKGVLPATFMAIAPGSHHSDVWHDVNRMLTLNSAQARRNVQLHICPLQFDIVDRIINRYSNRGETVLDPFAGIGTIPLRALKSGRYGIGIELNPESVKDAVSYLTSEAQCIAAPTLFKALEDI